MQSILLIGRPGCGKGTQADLLKERLGFEIVILGNLLREKAKEKGSFTSKKLKEAMNTGDLLPTIIVSFIWFKNLEELKNKKITKNIIFDGFARKLIEAELLFQALDWFELGDFRVIYIDISAKESANRIRKRKMCDKCKTIFMGDYQGDKCDKCNSPLIIRGDQTEKVIKKREKEFIKETIPVLDYFKKRGVLEIVDGEQSVENVYRDIKLKIGDF